MSLPPTTPHVQQQTFDVERTTPGSTPVTGEYLLFCFVLNLASRPITGWSKRSLTYRGFSKVFVVEHFIERKSNSG